MRALFTQCSSSVNFDSWWKLFGSFPAGWVIYNEEEVHIYWSVPYWEILPREENLISPQMFIQKQKPSGGVQ